MAGKIKRIRQKLHHGAVKLQNYSESKSTPGNLEKAPIPSAHVQSAAKTLSTQPKINTTDSSVNSNAKPFNFPSGVFAGTKITPETLVQTLKFDEPSNVTVTKQTGGELKGTGEKKQQSKKEKIKERRERWLNKISAIKHAREQQVAQARRKATPVVGDMRPLADALPELSQLLPSLKSAHRKNKAPVKKKPEPTDFSLMKPAQKRKLLENEALHFSEAMKNPTYKTNPLAAIGEHLRKRFKQEDEQS
ncbi:ribosome biogenesis protein SLX9 homolog [Myxocyprinus asiaticus]|uniref:ribosome biogenesis protein SLX9 homolog n=1 Tax=Myxocyprinus asiaticus TaxID=70543 RepID=UPI002222E8D0|nr:ribosome biogenesis protein SLX9 homolog [Myxocyprinus asiaticus]